MPRIAIPFLVVMDDGRELKLSADQRDIALLEAAGLDGTTFLRVRHLAWTAMRRQHGYKGSWDQFNETDCVEVLDDGDGEAGEELDPGTPGQNGPG